MDVDMTFLKGLWVSFDIICQMGLIALLGFFFVKKNWLTQQSLTDLSRMLIDGIVPCVFIVSMARGMDKTLFHHGIILSTIVLAWTVGSYLICSLAYTLNPGEKVSEDRAATAMTMIQNGIYLPLPILLAIVPKVYHDQVTIYVVMAIM